MKEKQTTKTIDMTDALKNLKNAIIDKYNNGKKIHPDDVFKFTEAYHKAKVEAISDEDINNRFPDSIILPNNNFQGTSKVSQRPQNTFKRFGAKWFKQQLLKQ